MAKKETCLFSPFLGLLRSDVQTMPAIVVKNIPDDILLRHGTTLFPLLVQERNILT